MISRVDHVSIAVHDFDKAFNFFTGILGAIPGSLGEDPRMQYKWEVFSLGDMSRLELITPTGSKSFLNNFLKDRLGGVHHITLQTPDIKKARQILEEHGIPHFGFNDYGPIWKEIFIHPKDAFGVLVQLAEFNADDWISPSLRMQGNSRCTVEKNDEGIKIAFAHPGGGKASVSLDVEEAKKLYEEISAILFSEGKCDETNA